MCFTSVTLKEYHDLGHNTEPFNKARAINAMPFKQGSLMSLYKYEEDRCVEQVI